MLIDWGYKNTNLEHFDRFCDNNKVRTLMIDWTKFKFTDLRGFPDYGDFFLF